MIWRMDCNHHSQRKSVDGAFPQALSWLRGAGWKALVSAGGLSVVSCSKMSLPQTAQEQTGPASESVTSGPSDTAPTSGNAAPPQATPVSLRRSTDSGVAAAPPVAPALRPSAATGAKEAAMKM